MARGSPTGLQVLERKEAHLRWWLWSLVFVVVLLASAAAFLLVHAFPAVERLPAVARLYDERQWDEVAAALLVTSVGIIVLGIVAARQFSRAGTVARQQRATLDAIVANVPEAILVADDRGHFRANAAAVRLFGLPAETGDAVAYHKAMAGLDRRNPETGLRIPAGAGVLEAALAGSAQAMDLTIKTADGLRTVHMAGSPIPFAPRTQGGLILASDVTQRLEIQAELQAAKESLEQKNAQHLQMARAIAHDLGNALTPAEMHVKILEMGKGDPKRSVAPLARSVAQMHRLVGDLSDMARLESGAMAVAVRPFPLAEALDSAVASYAPIAETKGVALVAPRASQLVVQADPERVGQVLSNLLSNAVKFTPQGGTVTLAVERTAASVRVAVTDSGLGLDNAQMERLFRPFSQVHDPVVVRERGTGLGLYISKGLIEKQGGEMGVMSPGPGKGSTFWFTLMLAPTPP